MKKTEVELEVLTGVNHIAELSETCLIALVAKLVTLLKNTRDKNIK